MLVVWISGMKLDDFYYSGFSDSCPYLCYIHNVSKLTTVCLSYFKGLAERIQKICCSYDIRTIFTSGSILWRYLFHVNPHKNLTWLRTVSTPSHAEYKGKICHPLKVRPEEHQKVVVWGEIEKSGMVDHICKKNHLPLWDEVKIIGEKHWKIRHF